MRQRSSGAGSWHCSDVRDLGKRNKGRLLHASELLGTRPSKGVKWASTGSCWLPAERREST